MRIFEPGSYRCLCTAPTCSCPTDAELFIDMRPLDPRRRLTLHDYAITLRRYRYGDVYGVVSPDAPGNFRHTYASYLLYAPEFELYGDVFLVLQQYWDRRYVEQVADGVDARHVAVPIWHGAWGPCKRHTEQCIPKVMYVLDRLCTRVEKIHLQASSWQIAKALYPKIQECEDADTRISMDMYTHRKQIHGVGGYIQETRNGMEMLKTWLKKEGLIRG